MSFLVKLKKYISQPRLLFKRILYRYGGLLNDTIYLKAIYYCSFGKQLNLKEPKTFNEKLQWLKLNDSKAKLSSALVDKYLVKEYVASNIGGKYLIKTLGLWDDVEDIDFNKLPNQFVLKCTHNSGGLVICKNKKDLNINVAKKLLAETLKKPYYKFAREYVYKGVKPRIIAEAYMEDNESGELKDYKFYCFNGEPKILLYMEGRHKGALTSTFYDMDFNKLPFTRENPREEMKQEIPYGFNEMINLARQLSKDFIFLRVDFYSINNRTYFGELTFYPGAGLSAFTPEEWDKKLGDMMELPKK